MCVGYFSSATSRQFWELLEGKWDPENFRGVDRLVKYYDWWVDDFWDFRSLFLSNSLFQWIKNVKTGQKKHLTQCFPNWFYAIQCFSKLLHDVFCPACEISIKHWYPTRWCRLDLACWTSWRGRSVWKSWRFLFPPNVVMNKDFTLKMLKELSGCPVWWNYIVCIFNHFYAYVFEDIHEIHKPRRQCVHFWQRT